MKSHKINIIATIMLLACFCIALLVNIIGLKHAYEVNRIKTTAKVVMLTFDDGPTGDDEAILDILKTYNVHATFFYDRS